MKIIDESWTDKDPKLRTPFFVEILENWQKAAEILPAAKFRFIYGGYIVTFNRPAHFDNRRKQPLSWCIKKFGVKIICDKTVGWQEQSKSSHYLVR